MKEIELTYKVGNLPTAAILIYRDEIPFAMKSIFQLAQSFGVSNVTFKAL